MRYDIMIYQYLNSSQYDVHRAFESLKKRNMTPHCRGKQNTQGKGMAGTQVLAKTHEAYMQPAYML